MKIWDLADLFDEEVTIINKSMIKDDKKFLDREYDHSIKFSATGKIPRFPDAQALYLRRFYESKISRNDQEVRSCCPFLFDWMLGYFLTWADL